MKTITLFKILLCFDMVLAGVVYRLLFYLIKGPASPSVNGTWFFVLMLLTFVILSGIVLK
ncbi:MAG: hypothetical protein ABIR15_14340 [Chitinophagaceae bacterium]